MKETEVNVTHGPWPAAVAEQLASHGILRWQTLKRHYGPQPEALARIIPGTSAQDWLDWLSELPPVPQRPGRTYAMGLIPDTEQSDTDQDQKEADHEDDTAGMG